jgi:hypothetical protein
MKLKLNMNCYFSNFIFSQNSQICDQRANQFSCITSPISCPIPPFPRQSPWRCFASLIVTHSTSALSYFSPNVLTIGVHSGVSKGVEEESRLPTLRVDHLSGVARPQGIERLGMAGLGETLGSPWAPLAIRLWCKHIH